MANLCDLLKNVTPPVGCTEGSELGVGLLCVDGQWQVVLSVVEVHQQRLRRSKSGCCQPVVTGDIIPAVVAAINKEWKINEVVALIDYLRGDNKPPEKAP